MDNQSEMRAFDMGALRSNLPQNRRGLSRYYTGKARSFACIADVRCVEDLKKQEHGDAKKRMKYSKMKEMQHYTPYPCRGVSSTNHCASPRIGV
ncbi:hypothetical protein PTKIN_Ptkin10aG0148100 [Pterospermum kingtungense]